jgi:uncharacterized protein YjbI with pentapeptide repeats
MGFFRKVVIVAGILLVFTLAGNSFTNAQGEGTDSRGVDGVAAVPVIQPAETETVSADTVKKSKKKVVKKRKKHAAKKIDERIAETNPGKRLSVNQVMVILKTTRDLSGKNLVGLQLTGVNMTKCNLKGVDLSFANLERADLGESDLERADLTGTNLKMSNLRLSGMTGTNLERAILDGAVWKDGMVCAAGSIGQCLEFQPR